MKRLVSHTGSLLLNVLDVKIADMLFSMKSQVFTGHLTFSLILQNYKIGH